MTRFVRISGAAVLMLLCWSASAQAFGWRFFGYRTYYYAPVRMVYYPAYYPAYVIPNCYPAPIPVPQYSMPKAAPASSQTGEPPLGNSKPTVTESRSHGAKYAPAVDDRCRVGFWNISGKDVTILVDGKSRSLARNRAVTLELARNFSWQIDGRQQEERVPDGQSTFDIVLRP